MAKGMGQAIAKAAPAPSALKGAGGAYSEGESSPEDEDKAAKVSAMQEFMDAAGMVGDAETLCDLLERYLDIAGR